MAKAHIEERVVCAACKEPRCERCEPDRCPKCFSVHNAGPSRRVFVEPIRGILGKAVPAFGKESV